MNYYKYDEIIVITPPHTSQRTMLGVICLGLRVYKDTSDLSIFILLRLKNSGIKNKKWETCRKVYSWILHNNPTHNNLLATTTIGKPLIINTISIGNILTDSGLERLRWQFTRTFEFLDKGKNRVEI